MTPSTSGDTAGTGATSAPGEASPAEPFVRRLAASNTFKTLFREGMELVDEAANYLDGAGRDESKGLMRPVALGYASESMRLTTRLMQLASWLLLQRAVNEGELTPTQARAEKRRVRLSHQDLATAPEVFEQLPDRLRDLSHRSIRLQARVIHIDKLLYDKPDAVVFSAQPTAVQANFDRVRAAFETRLR